MSLPANDSPVWPIVRLFVVGLLMLGMFTVAGIYKTPLAIPDVILMITTLLGLAGFDVTKAFMVRK
jgi:hypothetical protein